METLETCHTKKEFKTATEHIDDLLHGTPKNGGQEWESLSADEILALFENSAKEIHTARFQEFQTTLSKRKPLKKALDDFFKTQHEGPSKKTVYYELANRCEHFADAMVRRLQTDLFYENNKKHLSLNYIEKPCKISKMLIEKTREF